MAITLQELLVKVGMDISEYASGVDAVVGKSGALGDSLNKTAGSTDTLMQGLDKLGSSLSRIGSTMTAAITLPIVGVGVAALKMSSDLQQATIAFTTMLGSAQAAQTHLQALRDFAMKTPFEFNDLVTASKRLQALGFTASQIIPTLTAVGDAAAALGSGAQGIERITLALGQMQAKGKVSAEEMRQLAEAGIPAWQLLADAMTKAQGHVVSVADTMKMAEKGMIDGTAAVQVLLEGMEGKFQGLMGNQMQTIGGMFSNLKDQAAKVLAEIGDALTPIGKHLLESMTGVLATIEDIVKGFQQLPEPIQAAVLAMTALAAGTGPVLLAFGKVTELVTSSVKAFGTLASLTQGMSFFGGLATDAAGATVAIGGTTAALSALVLVAAGLVSALTGAFLGFKQLSTDLAPLHSLDKDFSDMLTKMTAGTTGPLALGEGRYDKVIETLQKALEAEAITDKEFAKLMLMVEANRKASEKDILSSWGSGLDTSKLQIKGGTSAAGSSLIKTATDPDAAKKALADAMGVLGVVDLQANVKRFQDAYALVASSGKATTDQLAAAWEKVKAAQDAARVSLEKFTGWYDQAKPFNMDSLPKLNNVQQQITSGVVDHESARAAQEVAQYIDQAKAAQIALNDEAAKWAKLGDESLDRYNALLLTLRDDSAEAGIFAGNMKVTAEEMQAVVDAGEALGDPFAVLNASAEDFVASLEKGVGAIKRTELGADSINAALRTLGVTMRDDSSAVQSAWETVQKAYDDGKVGAVQYERAQLAAIEDIVKQQRAAGIAITADQSKAIYDLQQKLSAANRDIWGDVHKEVSGIVNALDDSLAKALFHLSDFGKIMKDSLSKIGEQLASSILKAFSKPFADALSESISDAITPVVSKISGWLSGLFSGGSKVADLANLPLSAGNTLNGLGAIPGLGSVASGAGGAAKTATGAAGSATSAAGSLASIASIANIASAVTGIASGIASGVQQAHMSADLQKIEESTRYMKIGLVTGADSACQDLHTIRNILTDFTSAHLNFGVLVDLVRELTDAKDATAEIRDFLYNPIGPLIQQMAAALSGSTAPVTTGADGTVIVPNGVFEVLIQAVKDSASSIVDGIKEGVQRLVDLATGATNTPTTTTQPVIEPTVSETTDTAAATTPYTPGIDYTRPQIIATSIPENQNVVNTLLTVNQSIVQGFADTIAQLKTMGGIAATGTGTDAPATGTDLQAATNQLLDGSTQDTQAITDSLTSLSTVVQSSSAKQIGSFTDLLTPIATALETSSLTPVAAREFGGFTDFLNGGGYTTNPEVTPSAPRTFGDGFTNFLTANDSRNNPSAAYYTMPMPETGSSWNPAVSIDPDMMGSGTTVNIINPTFRDPRDANAIVELVRNSL